MILLGTAWALTLDEAVRRAGEVDPTTLLANLAATDAAWQAAESWSRLAPSVSADVHRRWTAGTTVGTSSLAFSMPLVDASNIADAAQDTADVRTLRLTTEALRLDAQYVAAALFYEALAAEARVRAAEVTLTAATATAADLDARVQAGLDASLAADAAALDRIEAEASLETARMGVAMGRARLARALELEDVGELVAPSLTERGEAGAARWEQVAEQAAVAAGLERVQRWFELAPVVSLGVSTNLLPEAGVASLSSWSVTLGATWAIDGLFGPYFRLRQAYTEHAMAKVELDATRRDFALAAELGLLAERSASTTLTAARARVKVADQALSIGQARLRAGLADPLQVLRLQEDAAEARLAVVEAELAVEVARLEVGRAQGVPWE